MPKSTVSAMPHRSSKVCEFDFDAFLRCKHYLHAKDERIIAFLAQNISKNVPPGQSTVRLLDVGSGEASVIERTCLNLGAFLRNGATGMKHIEADCIEPSQEGIRFVNSVAHGAHPGRVAFHPRCSTVEEFLNGTEEFYDAILCIHLLYHVKKHQWRALLRRLSLALKPGGVLFVNLVSQKSDIYSLWTVIQRQPGSRAIPRMFDCYGYEYYAEEFERVLPATGKRWEKHTVSAEIHFSRNAVHAARVQLQGGEENSEMLHFLAFMFRVHTKELVTLGSVPLLQRLKMASNGITFKTIDRMFMYKKARHQNE